MRSITYPIPPRLTEMIRKSGTVGIRARLEGQRGVYFPLSIDTSVLKHVESLGLVLLFDDGVIADDEISPVSFSDGVVREV